MLKQISFIFDKVRDTRDDDRYRDRSRRDDYRDRRRDDRDRDRERPRDRDDRDRRSREHDRDRRDRDRRKDRPREERPKDRGTRPLATRIELPREIQYPQQQKKVDPQQDPFIQKNPADAAALARRKSRFEQPSGGDTGGPGPVPAPETPAEPPAAQCDKNPDGSENLAVKYKDEGLNMWVRREGEEKALFTEEDVDGTLTFTCAVCGAKLYGVRNISVHYNGKKHKNKLAEEGWTTFDPIKEPPKNTGESENGGESGAEKQQTLESEMAAFEKELKAPEEITID